jgi:hypothetical protein
MIAADESRQVLELQQLRVQIGGDHGALLAAVIVKVAGEVAVADPSLKVFKGPDLALPAQMSCDLVWCR